MFDYRLNWMLLVIKLSLHNLFFKFGLPNSTAVPTTANSTVRQRAIDYYVPPALPHFLPGGRNAWAFRGYPARTRARVQSHHSNERTVACFVRFWTKQEVLLPGIEPRVSVFVGEKWKKFWWKWWNMKKLLYFPNFCLPALVKLCQPFIGEPLQQWKTVKNWQAKLLPRSNKAARHCQHRSRALQHARLFSAPKVFLSANEASTGGFCRDLLLKQLLVFKEGHGREQIRGTHSSPLLQSH